MDLLQKDVPTLTKIYEAKCFYDSQNNRIILYYKNRVTARTLVDFYNLSTTPPPNSSLYVIYDLQTGTFNVSTNPPTYTISNSKVRVTSPINAEYDMDKVIIYRISWYEKDTYTDLNHILTQLNTIDTDIDNIRTQLNTFVRKQQADTITATHTFDPTQPGPAFQLGPNAQNQLIQYLNADKVDGFNASQTPTPNTIPVALSTGKLDIGWLPDGIGSGYRRVDLTGATSDYNLQVGEEAIIRFSNLQLVPLRINVEQPSSPLNPVIYNIVICIYWASGNNLNLDFFPNNTTYSAQIANVMYVRSENGWGGLTGTMDRFWVNSYDGNDNYPRFDNLYAVYYGASQQKLLCGTAFSNLSVCIYSGIWNNTSTAWTSLGSFRIYPDVTRNISGMALVRRLA
jgi:hypothetical protein